jgi:hypothetical protein
VHANFVLELALAAHRERLEAARAAGRARRSRVGRRRAGRRDVLGGRGPS